MKRFLILLLFVPVISVSQNMKLSGTSKGNISSERIYTHINSSFLLVGEYMYYSVYCLQGSDNKRSDLSKIAYIDIIDSNKDVLYHETIDLKDGLGYGDFFIPTNIQSGNYKMIVYTNWMKNNSNTKYFEQNIFIINPYTSAQKQVRRDSVVYGIEKIGSKSSIIGLKQNEFANREQVNLNLESVPSGNYSVSVRQLDSIPHPSISSAIGFSIKNQEADFSTNTEDYIIPDLRGKLVTGSITTKNGSVVANKKIALSVPGKDYFIQVGNTSNEGKFYFNVDENFSSSDALIQVLNDSVKYDITLDEDQLPELQNLNFENFGIDNRADQLITDRSVHNQIENAYFSLKPDTVEVSKRKNIFDGVDKITYNLDEYTRFETIKETFVEVISYARVRNAGGKLEFAVLGKEPYQNYSGTPLVFVDGIPLEDSDNFIRGYASAKIDRIMVIQDKYYLGSALFKGVIIIETINGDYAEEYNKDLYKSFSLTSGNIHKSYFKQDYSNKKNNSLPDFRTQLLWDPELKVGEDREVSFYTSDVDGIFEISIQGFSDEGEPISVKETFEVE